MAEGRRSWPIAAVALGLVAIGAACGSPRPAGTLDDLNRWSESSASIDEDGTRLIETYEGWPMADPPLVYACATAPKNAFGGDPSHFLPADEPSCSAFDVTLNGGRLTSSIDRAALPDAFDGLESWTVVMGLSTPEWDWSISKSIPADLPDPPVVRPAASESPAP